MKKNWLIALLLGLVIGVVFSDRINLLWQSAQNSLSQQQLISPLIESAKKPLPLTKYTIPALVNYPFEASEIELGELVDETDEYNTFTFYYQTTGRRMSGQLNIPNEIDDSSPTAPVVLMIRGYVPQATYTPGTGTRNAAAVFARNGYITIAPDFLGFGESDPESEDTWEARLIKPVNVVELIMSMEETGIPLEDGGEVKPSDLQIWAHSNGGQIALTMLEIYQRSIPTTMWAPVTAPFPYSVLFYSDENEDEGKEARAWVSQFEQDYNALDFSLTQHLNLLNAPIQIHQGTNDDAVPFSWNDEFVEKIQLENERRLEANKESDLALPEIDLTYHRYPGADHNLQPAVNWSTAVQRDLEFFEDN